MLDRSSGRVDCGLCRAVVAAVQSGGDRQQGGSAADRRGLCGNRTVVVAHRLGNRSRDGRCCCRCRGMNRSPGSGMPVSGTGADRSVVTMMAMMSVATAVGAVMDGRNNRSGARCRSTDRATGGTTGRSHRSTTHATAPAAGIERAAADRLPFSAEHDAGAGIAHPAHIAATDRRPQHQQCRRALKEAFHGYHPGYVTDLRKVRNLPSVTTGCRWYRPGSWGDFSDCADFFGARTFRGRRQLLNPISTGFCVRK